jgi:hypothetical protein
MKLQQTDTIPVLNEKQAHGKFYRCYVSLHSIQRK